MRVLFSLFCFLFAANFVFAAEVGLDGAKNFARGWRGRGVRAARTHKTAAGESRFHVVSFEGGGWAAVGTDDEESPVIAFSDDGEDLVEDERNAVWFLVKRDAERRAKERGLRGSKGSRGRHKGWGEKKVRSSFAEATEDKEVGGVKTATVKTSTSEGALYDVRVAPLVQSKWNQLTANNYAKGPLCYNYYTPNNYYCGCVATMMAQMMRYHEWPKKSVEAKTFPCYVGTTIPDEILESDIVDKKMIGGIYNWEKMILNPSSSTSLASRQEIGKLCYDCGVSVSMMWSSVGSGAFMSLVREALVDTFGYSDTHLVVYDYPTEKNPVPFHSYDFEELKTIVVSNCEAGLPVGYGISGKSGGHAVVIDGYGYSDSGEFYMHINPGWSGDANAWYNPPNLSMGGYAFDSSDELVYNIFPEGSGAIVTGRVVDQCGNPVAGATVGGYLVYEEDIEVPWIGQWTKTQLVTRTNEVASVTTDANGKYCLKTGLMGYEAKLYATAEKPHHHTQTQTTDLSSAQTMLGSRDDPFGGGYSTNGYSLGNKIDFDFVLPKLTPPKVIFR